MVSASATGVPPVTAAAGTADNASDCGQDGTERGDAEESAGMHGSGYLNHKAEQGDRGADPDRDEASSAPCASTNAW
ncbi:hypothetical protein GCM10022285_43200 [Streptomyces tunisiensis]|uniref:Uncharacterized protein n=1 Tax=Streptomyces tunisiensis TaxID=948699 RepID=A0ABP7YVS9_9ACTN